MLLALIWIPFNTDNILFKSSELIVSKYALDSHYAVMSSSLYIYIYIYISQSASNRSCLVLSNFDYLMNSIVSMLIFLLIKFKSSKGYVLWGHIVKAFPYAYLIFKNLCNLPKILVFFPLEFPHYGVIQFQTNIINETNNQ